MKMNVFSVYDRGVGAFMQPFFCRSKGEAVRSFMDAVSDGKTNFCKHPDDFTLFEIADFSEDNAQFLCPKVPERCISALECRADQADVPWDEGVRGNGKSLSGPPDFSGSR